MGSCALLGAGAVFTLGLIGRRVFRSNWAGLVGAALAAAYAALWINDEMLMSESMYVLTSAIAVFCAYKFWDNPNWKFALLMGATIAIAGEVTLDQLWHAVPAFPTVSEVWLHLLETYGL